MYARPDLSRRIPDAEALVVLLVSPLFLSRSSRALARRARTSSRFPSIALPFSQQSFSRCPLGCRQIGFEQVFVEFERPWKHFPECIARAVSEEPFSRLVLYTISCSTRSDRALEVAV